MIPNKISAITATNLVVANMIGTGIFTSLGFQVAAITSDFALMALWAVGGLAALCGALSYAELATALPRSGGEYHYLSRIYHPSIGFLAGWISAVVGFPAPIALAGIAFGEYFKVFIPGISPVVISLLVVWIITAVHLFGLRTEELFHNGATFLKIGLIFVLIIAGLLISHPQQLDFSFGPRKLWNPCFRSLRCESWSTSCMHTPVGTPRLTSRKRSVTRRRMFLWLSCLEQSA